jgi:ABC-2 type transport system permease protein
MQSTAVETVISSMMTIVMFLIPIITMRLFSEDKRQKTDQALLTAPINLLPMVMGKLLAAFSIYSIAFSLTFVYAIVISAYGEVSWSLYFSNLLGILLFGVAMIAIGGFVSSLTENQVVSAIGSFAIMLILSFVDSLASLVPYEWLQKVIMGVSVYNRYTDFAMGQLDYSDAVFFLSVAAIFIFLTVRVFEKKRWA